MQLHHYNMLPKPYFQSYEPLSLDQPDTPNAWQVLAWQERSRKSPNTGKYCIYRGLLLLLTVLFTEVMSFTNPATPSDGPI